MTYRSLTIRCALVVFLVGAGCAVERSADAEEITALIMKYAQSVDAADTELASEIWANDASFIHPMGYERGWTSVKTNIYEKLMGETFSERKLNVTDIVVHAYPDMAWAEFNWDFVAKLRSDGTTLTSRGRESQVYRKTDGRWRLVHVHYSGMPVTEEG